IKGYQIPGVTERIIVNMYADDTTIYLTRDDCYSDLEEILQTWCNASGAKFNLGKTEILPIGTAEHRQRVIQTRKLNEKDNPWQDQIRIAQDGNPIRSLGAWIGNNVEHATSWEPVLEKIEKNFKRWELGHPSIAGKKHIVQMVAGGMTQFLAKAQGMPKSIENAITKQIRDFIWNEKRTPPISNRRLERPIAE
ncbi:hypothetical protein CY34DRAFT_41449, partial [Suillus luteus UH-Slu-Lm8-n1]